MAAPTATTAASSSTIPRSSSWTISSPASKPSTRASAISASSSIPSHGEPGRAGKFQHHLPSDYGQGIFTTGNAEDYITGEDSYGIHARHTGEGRAGIDVRNVSVRTTGDHSHGVYAWQQGSYRLGEDGNSYRARGAVIVNLIETDRDRDQRVRPLVATSGDAADAVRAQYTRAAARGHIAVTVEGYTLSTGGILPLDAVASPQDPSTYVFDPNRPSVPNKNYDPDDPSSPRFINVLVHPHRVDDAGNRLEAVDLRPYTAVYLPRSNPDYDPDNPDSPPVRQRRELRYRHLERPLLRVAGHDPA